MQLKNTYNIIVAILIIGIVVAISYYLKTKYFVSETVYKYKTKIEIVNEKIEEYEVEIKKLKGINDSLNIVIDKRSSRILTLKDKRNSVNVDSIKTDEELIFVIKYLRNIK